MTLQLHAQELLFAPKWTSTSRDLRTLDDMAIGNRSIEAETLAKAAGKKKAVKPCRRIF